MVFKRAVAYFDLMLAICFFLALGGFVIHLLFLVYTSRASRRKNNVKEAGSLPFQANSCGRMATASPESVREEEEEVTHTSGKEGRQPSSPGAEGKQPSPAEAEGEGWTVAGGGKFSHPVYKKLSSLSGELNGLPLSNVKEKLNALNLSSMYVHTAAPVLPQHY